MSRWLALCLLLFLPACTLTRYAAEPIASPTPPPAAATGSVLAAPTATLTPTPALALPSTSTSAPLSPPTSASAASALSQPTPCAPRGDWTGSYTIQGGDTLSSIARSHGLTVDALAAGNCIADPSLIRAGTALRLPPSAVALAATPYGPLPPVPVPTTAATQPPPGATVGIVVFDPAPSRLEEGGVITVWFTPGQRYVIAWHQLPAAVTQVEFVYVPADRTQPPVSIGITTALPDGTAQVAWVVPANLNGTLVGNAPLPGQARQFLYSPEIQVRLPGAVTATPVIGQAAGTLGVASYVAYDWNAAPPTYTLQANVPTLVSWTGIAPDLSGLGALTFKFTPDGGAPQVLAVDPSPADGMSITFTPLSGMNGTLTAVAANGTYSSTIRIMVP